MYDGVQDLAPIMSMASADGTEDVALLIHYRELFVFIIFHLNFSWNKRCLGINDVLK